MKGKDFIDALLKQVNPRNLAKKKLLTDAYLLTNPDSNLSTSQMEIISDNIDNCIQSEGLNSTFLGSLAIAAYINSCR